MAGHDDGKGVSPEGLANGAGGAGGAGAGGELAVRERLAGGDRARRFVDEPVKGRHAAHVEHDGAEIARLVTQEGDDAPDGALHLGRGRRLFARLRKAPPHAGACGELGRLGKLHGSDAVGPPGDGAEADGGVKNREARGRHGGQKLPPGQAGPLAESCPAGPRAGNLSERSAVALRQGAEGERLCERVS